MKMPSKKQYDLVSEDGYDSRIPLHNDEAFQHGIHFQAKYVGTLDVPRPSSRVEIVAAMRKIRYDFKAKAIKKKKVCLTISVEGVRVSQRKNRRRTIATTTGEESRVMIMHHPIFRIFYVSHDSQDLKIWSYIARDGPTNCFKCNVFKAYKKSQAMRIVRTIGQAFEVCHKLSIQNGQESACEDVKNINLSSEDSEIEHVAGKQKDKTSPHTSSITVKQDGRITPPNQLAIRQAENLLLSMANKMPGKTSSTISSSLGSADASGNDLEPLPISAHHQMVLLQQQIEQQKHQTQLAVAQVHLLKDQLTAESAARIEAQARAHQMLMHNRDMLDHMAHLVTKLHDLELRINTFSNSTENMPLVPLNLQTPIYPDPTTPQAGPVYTPDTMELELQAAYSLADDRSGHGNTSEFDTESPDSGHREMSNDSLSRHLNRVEATYWQNILKGLPVTISSPDVLFNEHSSHVSDMLSVRGNPFANGFDDNFDNGEFHNPETNIITPLPPQDASGNRIELKMKRAPKLDPPPEFRNSKSYRDSQYSVQSSDSVSSQDFHPLVNVMDGDLLTATGATAINGDNNSLQLKNESRSNTGPNLISSDSRSITATSESVSGTVSTTCQGQSNQTHSVHDDPTPTWQSQIPRSHSFQSPKSPSGGIQQPDVKITTKASTLNGRGNNGPYGTTPSPSGLFTETVSISIKPAPPPPPPRNMDRLSIECDTATS